VHYGPVANSASSKNEYQAVSSQIHAPSALPQRKSPGTHWIGGCVGPRAGLDDMPVGSSYSDYATVAHTLRGGT
jgi:hypothetical protein